MTDGEQGKSDGVQRAPLNKGWVIKIVVILVVLLGFGVWGLYDALVVYPNRGAAYASLRELQYLQKLNEAEAEQFGIFTSEASVEDPAEEYALLNDPETLNRLRASSLDPSSSNTLRASARLNRLEWLRGLRTIGKMTPENTTLENPRERLAELSKDWVNREAPKQLASYDIMSQWLIAVGAWSGAVCLILLILKTMSRKYTWDPSEQRLTVSGGRSIVPSDLVEVDKRKWDKFIVFLRLREGHELGTGELKFDTYRHAKLEGWILEMEEARFGPQEDGEKPSKEDQAGESQTSENAPDATDQETSQEPEQG